MNVGTPNPRVAIGDNQPPAPITDEHVLVGLLRSFQVPFNKAAMQKRHAAEKMRDQKRDFQSANPDVYDAIESMRESALEKMKEKLRARPEYVAAETDKTAAAKVMRDTMKEAKAAGIDTKALRFALKLQDMDLQERKDHFDAMDIYAKALKLWGDGYDDAKIAG